MKKSETFARRAAIVGVSVVYCFEGDCECVLVAPDMETLRRMWGLLTLAPLNDEHCQHVLIIEDKLREPVPEKPVDQGSG